MAKRPRNRKTGWGGQPKKSEVVTLRVPPALQQAIEGGPRADSDALGFYA